MDRPSQQPPFSLQNDANLPSSDVQTLEQQLNDALMKIQNYKDTIVSQANELTMFRNNTCQVCRQKVTLALFPEAPQVVVASTALRRRRSASPPDNTRNRRVRRRLTSTTGSHSSMSRSNVHNLAPSLSVSSQAIPNTSSLIATPSVLSRQIIPSDLPATTPDKNPNSGRDVSSWYVEHNIEGANRSPDVTFIRTFTHKAFVFSVRFSPDGKYLAVGLRSESRRGGIGKALIYDVESGTIACSLTDYSSKEDLSVENVCFSPDGTTLATALTVGEIRLWEISSQRTRALLKGHKKRVTFLGFVPHGRLLVSASWDHSIRIWNVRDGSCKNISNGNLSRSLCSVSLSLDGRFVTAVNGRKELSIWDIRTGQVIGTFGDSAHVAFMPDGKGLVGCRDNTVRYWNVGPRSEQSTEQAEVIEFEGHTDVVRCVTSSPDGLWIISGSYDGTARIWNPRNNLQKCTLLGHKGTILSLDCNAAGDCLAVGDSSGHVSLWRYTMGNFSVGDRPNSDSYQV